MSDIQTLRHLTSALYEASMDSDRLPVFLRELTSLTGADAGVLAAAGPPKDLAPTSTSHGVAGLPGETLRPFLDPADASRPDDPAAWRRVLNDPGVSDSLALAISGEDAAGDNGFLALLRRNGVFPHDLRDDLEAFRPHLPHALRLLRRIDSAEQARLTARRLADASGHALALIDTNSRLVAANRAFERLLRTEAGLDVQAGRTLTITDAGAQTAFLALLSRATLPGFPGGAVSVPRGPDHRPLGLVAAPIAGDDEEAPRLLRLHLSAQEAVPVPPLEVLRGLFDLTPAEAELLQALIGSQRIEDVAANRGVSVTTARTQLAHLFRKTGTNRQPELVRLATLAACTLDYGG